MVQREESWAEVSVPRSVAAWLYAISERAGEPAHRVMRVLLDGYIERLPPAARAKFDEILRARRGRHIQ
jgi:hypothetical protein